ncbi:unnamed protein product, partial [Laminaria digitata]
QLHKVCFRESGVVFSDTDGCSKYGCDCGQFHLGVGLTEGVYGVSSGKLVDSRQMISSSTEWCGGTDGERELGEEQAREALEACPVFRQADPSALAIVDGGVALRPATTVGAMDCLDPDSLATRLSRQDVLSRAEARHLLREGTAILDKEDNVLELEGETVVVGDLHGQFFDLLKLLNTYGKPPQRQYLFLGDYVDRGVFSCEVALYLVALKVAFPMKVHLIRGNHETANQTAACGFKEECFTKYGSEIYDTFLECFSALPVCAVLSQQGQPESLFCVHGGISPRLRSVDDIRRLQRRVEPEDGTLLSDLLWSDPSDDPSVCTIQPVPTLICDVGMIGTSSPERTMNRVPQNGLPTVVPVLTYAKRMSSIGCAGHNDDGFPVGEGDQQGFQPNLVRGCSWSYDWGAVDAFLKANSFRGILRAHSVQGEGYHQHFQGSAPASGIGEGVVTVFSAPMYTTHSNRGGVLVVKGDGGVDALGYDAAPEPLLVNR